jgi:hypothetical protein
MRDALRHANALDFFTSVGYGFRTLAVFENRGYTHFIFVYSEDDFLAGEFPDDAIVAWPSLRTLITLDVMNNMIRDNSHGVEIDLEAHSRTYPLTVEDIIDNWQNFVEFRFNLGDTAISHTIQVLRDREYFRIMFEELGTLAEILKAVDIEIAEYGFETGRDFNAHMDFLLGLYENLDKDVQLQLQAEAPNLMAEYRTIQRGRQEDARWRAEREVLEKMET